MKLLVLAALVGAAVGRPQVFGPGQSTPFDPSGILGDQPPNRGPGPFDGNLPRPGGDDLDEMPAPERKGFMAYLDGLRKIFANPKNHAKLQEFFQSPEMAQWIFQRFHKRPSVAFPSQLRTNYQDSVFSSEEFQAWYPSLLALAKTMNMEPVVAEEWGMADTDGDENITPENLWTMLRDGVANKFFPSFMTLAFSESTKHMPGPFWTTGKRDAFQRGIWGQIAGLRPISDKGIKQLADEIEKFQGTETAENFMVDMGMGSEISGSSLPVQTLDGTGQVDIKVQDDTPEDPSEPKQPKIDASASILTMDGQQMPALKVAEDEGLTAVEGTTVPVEMPDGKIVMMSIGESSDEKPEEPQPMATLETPSGDTFQMPVISTTANDDGTSTTTIMTPEGTSMEVKTPTPKKESEGTANDETVGGGVVAEPATIEIPSKGQQIPATATPAEPLSEAAQDACIGLDACEPTTVTANNMKMTIPVETDGEEEITMTVEANGQKLEMDNVEAKVNEETGEITVEGDTPDGTTMSVTMTDPEAKGFQNEEGFQLQGPLGAGIVIQDDEGKPIIKAEVNSIQSAKLPSGARETTLTGNVNGTPTKITITSGEGSGSSDIVAPEGMSADEMSEIKMSVKVEGKPEQTIPVVKADGETITGLMDDGTEVNAPTPDKVDGDETVELKSSTGQTLELPIVSAQTTPDKSAERIVASNGQAKMTITVTGA